MLTFLKLLHFLRLTDPDDTLSLTNIGLIVVLARVATLQAPSLVDLTALLGMLLAYAHKRAVKAKGEVKAAKVDALEALATQAMAKTSELEGALTNLKARFVAMENRPVAGVVRR